MKKRNKRLCIHHADVIEIINDLAKLHKRPIHEVNWRRLRLTLQSLEGEESTFFLADAFIGDINDSTLAAKIASEILKILEYFPQQEEVTLSMMIDTCLYGKAAVEGKSVIDVPTYTLQVVREDVM